MINEVYRERGRGVRSEISSGIVAIATDARCAVGTRNREEDAEPQVDVDERRSDVDAIVDGGNRSNRRAPDTRERAYDDALHVQVSPDPVAAVGEKLCEVVLAEGKPLD